MDWCPFDFKKGGTDLSDQLKRQLNSWSSTHPRKHTKKQKEKLSQSDLRDLMGMNRPTYKRGKGGSYKQK